MNFQQLVKSHNWLSIEMTLLTLYPDQIEIINAYKDVFETIQTLEPVENDMLIVLKECQNDPFDDTEDTTFYIDVSGRKLGIDPNSFTNSYAIEFESWEKWLGMEIAPETLMNFNELEIISHCLYEMTFCGYEQDEIQEQLESIKKTVADYEDLSDEEKKLKTYTIEELKAKLDKMGSSE
ncbi:MAG: hypothetical protein CFE24_02340 [Flavobacterium sp. BFFFF2]|nr:MAG: hypothetical protein CFE24_02340 [Flavobacterium sp. BFFFF2]